jgi:uncharacterized Fe-S cluster-containing MiaB family protein
MEKFERYSIVTGKFPREIVLLQGRGCFWKRCLFCDYYKDVSDDPYKVNKEVLFKVKGSVGALDVINSGSALELDTKTLALLNKIIVQHSIGAVWFEANWQYHNYLQSFADSISAKNVKFRLGIETFDPSVRAQFKKGFPKDLTPEEISKYYKGVCLMVGMQGQTKEEVRRNIYIAKRYFEYVSVNLFMENTTPVKRDENLINWFKSEILPIINDDPQIEILLNNTDLGIGSFCTP